MRVKGMMNVTIDREVLKEVDRQKASLSRSAYMEKLLKEGLTARIRMPDYLREAKVEHNAWKTLEGTYFGDIAIYSADRSAMVAFPHNRLIKGSPYFERGKHPFSPFDCLGCQIHQKILWLVEEADPSRMEEGIPGIDYDPVTGIRFEKEG